VLRILSKLGAHALALTRDRAAADDLVQEAVVNAITARDSFQPGTDFDAWMHTILRNGFLMQRRAKRVMVDIEDVPGAYTAIDGDQESRIALGELSRAMLRLPLEMRQALVMHVVLGMPYEAVATAADIAVGTVKSRISRAREQLSAMLRGDEAGIVRSRTRGRHGAPPLLLPVAERA
jgi:RNA polymerase sigma-70 factor (ECF subfamily)